MAPVAHSPQRMPEEASNVIQTDASMAPPSEAQPIEAKPVEMDKGDALTISRLQKFREATQKTADRLKAGAAYHDFAQLFPTLDIGDHPFLRRGHDQIMQGFFDKFMSIFDEMTASTQLEKHLASMDEKCAAIGQTAHWQPEEKVRHEVMIRMNAKKAKIQETILEMETENRLLLATLDQKKRKLQEKEKQNETLLQQINQMGEISRKVPTSDMTRALALLKDVPC